MIQTVNRVANYLKSIPSLEAVYIVGSFSKGVTSHDIDMLLIFLFKICNALADWSDSNIKQKKSQHKVHEKIGQEQ